MSEREVLNTIDCGDDVCGACEAFDLDNRRWCPVYGFRRDSKRHPACLSAEAAARGLRAELKTYEKVTIPKMRQRAQLRESEKALLEAEIARLKSENEKLKDKLYIAKSYLSEADVELDLLKEKL